MKAMPVEIIWEGWNAYNFLWVGSQRMFVFNFCSIGIFLLSQITFTRRALRQTNLAAFFLRCDVISSLKVWGGFSIILVILWNKCMYMYVKKHVYNEVLGTSKFPLLYTYFVISFLTKTHKLNENFFKSNSKSFICSITSNETCIHVSQFQLIVFIYCLFNVWFSENNVNRKKHF